MNFFEMIYVGSVLVVLFVFGVLPVFCKHSGKKDGIVK